MIFRVVIESRYNEIYFEFDNLEEACDFAMTAFTRSDGDDNGGYVEIRIEIQRKEKKEANA